MVYTTFLFLDVLLQVFSTVFSTPVVHNLGLVKPHELGESVSGIRRFSLPHVND